ncbi:MAG TPA: hypothetical protein V6C58_02400 [Allocoleopsis sp.]
MNSEDPLFTNKFLSELSNLDVSSERQEQFRRYIESQNKEKKRSKFRTKQEVPVSHFLSQSNTSIRNQMQPKFKSEKTTIVSIDSRDRDTNLYPSQNNFKAPISATFTNVKKIRLISTEFPNTDQVIKDLPLELQNNLISWQNEEDYDLNFYTSVLINTIVTNTVDITVNNHGFTVGETLDIIISNSKKDSDLSVTGIIDGERRASIVDSNTFRILFDGGLSEQGTCNINLGFPIYTVQIKPGNYTASTLAERISIDTGKVKRRNQTGQYHYFSVTVNLDTDVMIFDSVITTQLPNNSLSTTAGSTTITVNQNSHGFKTGDRVKMIGVKNLAGISSSVLNGDFTVNVLDFNTFTYEVIVRANATTEGGGNTIQTGKDAPFRILFDTENTRIQFNTGFPDEDSSGYIGSTNPITTKNLGILNVVDIGSNKLRITTSSNHSLDSSSIINISSIGTGSSPKVTTSTPHGLFLPQRVAIRNTNSTPRINGTFFVTPTGSNTFLVNGQVVGVAGNTGEVLYGGDIIKIFGLRTAPNILNDGIFFVENIPSSNQFDITFQVSSIDSNSFSTSSIGTTQVTINHPNHSFNTLTSITNTTSNFASCKTYLPHSLVGQRTTNVDIIDGPVGTNTVDILLEKHGLVTSDTIKIEDSTTVPSVNGTYRVQVVTTDSLRINFVHATFTDGIGTVLTGDSTSIVKTNSIPRIDGVYNIHNKLIITSISTGTITSDITVSTNHNWSVGDVVSISGSNSTPNIDGEHTIQMIINSTTFSVNISNPVVASGNQGFIVNKNRFEIKTGVTLTTIGTNPAGILNRDNKVLHYRITAESEGVNDIGGIPISSLNGVERNISKLIDINNYVIRLDNEFATSTVTSGGSSVRVSSKIHGFRSIQANTDTGETTGKLYRSISLEGQNYVYLVIPGLSSFSNNALVNSSNVQDVFAKLLLIQSPGLMDFNSFMAAPIVFSKPLANLDLGNLMFRILTPEGFYFDLNDINYSFTLEITELIEVLQTESQEIMTNGREKGNQEQEISTSSGIKSGTLDIGASTSPIVYRLQGGRAASIGF